MKIIYKNKLLLLILIIAFLLRFIGVKPGYNQYHSDEAIIYGVAVNMIRNGNLDPERLDYPGASIYINYALYRLIFIPLYWLKYYLTNIPQILEGMVHIPIAPLEARKLLQTYIFGHREINVLFWGRYITASFGVGNVLLVYLLAKKMFGKSTGLVASLLLAFNFRHVLNSHIILPDIYNAFFLLLSLIITINLWHKPSIINYILAGSAAGLFFSVKYQFVSFLPLLLVHVYHSFEGKKLNFKRLFSTKVFAGAFSIPLVFLLINPYFLINIENAIYWMQTISQKYSMGVNKLNLYPYSYLYHIDYGPLLFLIIVLGVVLGLSRQFKKSLIILSVIVPFFFIMTYYSYGGFYVRNFITTTPLLYIFAAYFINALYRKLYNLVGKRWSQVLVFVFLGLVLYVSGRNSIISTYFYTKPWNYLLTADWMKNNLPLNAIVAAHPFDPPGGPEIIKTEFKLGGAYSLAEHQENNAGYALVNLDWASNPFYVWTNYGFSDARLFWNKPISILRNTFYGLAVEELFRYQIFSAVKPWQAPEADLVMAKIPKWPKVKMEVIRNFSFDKNLEGWVLRGKDEGDVNYNFDQGSIHIGPGKSRFGIKRISSPPVDIKGGYLYKINSLVKSKNVLTASKRNAFIRLDFYQEKNSGDPGIISAVSSRVYGSSDWVSKEIIERAPDGSKFLTIGLQFSESEDNEAWLDDVVLLESIESVSDITNSTPFNKAKIDLNLLYTYSHGNL